MRRETALQRDKVAFCKEQIELMEEHVGMIANNPNYKLEELEKVYNTVQLNPTSGGNQSSDPVSPHGNDE